MGPVVICSFPDFDIGAATAGAGGVLVLRNYIRGAGASAVCSHAFRKSVHTQTHAEMQRCTLMHTDTRPDTHTQIYTQKYTDTRRDAEIHTDAHRYTPRYTHPQIYILKYTGSHG